MNMVPLNDIKYDGLGAVWLSDLSGGNRQKVELITEPLKNMDKFVLNLPTAEAVYEKKELNGDCLTTYSSYVKIYEGQKGGSLIAFGSSSDAMFLINKDKAYGRTFSKSGADLKDINSAVEETLEYRYRTMETSTLNAAVMSGGSILKFTAQDTAYKYSSVSETSGKVSYKNGGESVYRETTASVREIYKKYEAFLLQSSSLNFAKVFQALI